ncbi:MAG TPA: preprotein translocase subunit SecE [Clostridiales bacterium]|jgi:preprotein translocase subunit SecE|nr:preprotein translocase subunit SecE [Clostridiales bacterium]
MANEKVQKRGFFSKVKQFFRNYKSEIKKITWSSKTDVVKNTAVVLVVMVAAAIVIALLDFGASTLIDLLGKIA